MSQVKSKSEIRTQFFDTLFSNREGYVCVATSDPRAPQSRFEQKFFEWPKQSIALENFILNTEDRKFNIYFCVNLLEKQERKKQWVLPQDFLWADLDAVDPTVLNPPPQILIESSPGRWQGIWLLTLELEPSLIEQYTKRIAYGMGADKSGWDLTQLIRVPFTKNHKYDPAPEVSLTVVGTETRCPPLLFESLPPLPDSEAESIMVENPMPGGEDIPDVEQVLYKYGSMLDHIFLSLYGVEPAEDMDWSRSLWRLINVCAEVGMTREEAFAVASTAKCNKYARDKRPLSHLWRDILKAYAGLKQITVLTSGYKPLAMPMIYDPDTPIHEDLLVDKYRLWAKDATDAVPQFHDLCSTILLSTIVANSVRLETSYGTLVPNLWGMILGDSTLSRKTTAMRMVTDLIAAIDPEMVLATDGTAEGLLTGLETRPNRTSIFYKDELSGFFHSINKREYLAGMPETLTALYDVPAIYTRRLRKDTIRIENPVFIFFGGGVRDEIYEALTENYVLSGFIPRFLIVSGDTDLSRLRRTGPPTNEISKRKGEVVSELADLYENYAVEVTQKIGGVPMRVPQRIMAHLSQAAWDRYGEIEEKMVNAANESAVSNLALPTFERLSRSILKMAIVFGASRQSPKDETVLIEKIDVDTAAKYAQDWGVHSIDLILNAGKKVSERVLDKLARSIAQNPGILRSTLMQHLHLSKREADELLGTLEDRAMVRKEKQGRGYAYWIA